MSYFVTTKWKWEPQFNLFLDSALHIYKHRCEEIGIDHLQIPCWNYLHILYPDESQPIKDNYPAFHLIDNEMRLQFDLAIHSLNKNDLEYKINILYKVFKKGSQKSRFPNEKIIWKKDESSNGNEP